jgi:hypothetical protein
MATIPCALDRAPRPSALGELFWGSLRPLDRRLLPFGQGRWPVSRCRCPIPRRRRPVPVAVGKLPVDRHLVPGLANVVPRMGLGVALAGSRIALLGQVVASGRLLVSPVGCLFTVRDGPAGGIASPPAVRPVWRASSSTAILPADGLPAMHMDIEDRLYPPVRLATIAARPEAASVLGTGPASCVTPGQVRPAGPRVHQGFGRASQETRRRHGPTDRHGG